MRSYLAMLLLCSYFIREAASATSCSTNNDCLFGGSSCRCQCCLVGVDLNLLGGTLTANLCVTILGGSLVCCADSVVGINACTPTTTTSTSTTTTTPATTTTQAPTTSPTTLPPTCQDPSRTCPRKECLDKYAQCAGWAKLGYCNENPERADIMEKDCPASCGYCNEICEDYDCPDRCVQKALAGDCINEPEYMLTRCKNTCTYCDRCVNLHSGCPSMAALCESTNATLATHMHFYCRATCGDCVPTSSCENLDPISRKCPRDWRYNPATNLCYWPTPTADHFAATRARCTQEGAELVSIHSDDENDFLTHLVAYPPYNQTVFYYIGLTKGSNGWANAQWLDNTPFNYSHWDLYGQYGNQPTSAAGEDWVFIPFPAFPKGSGIGWTDGYWHDWLNELYPGFCAKEVCSEETTTTVEAGN